MTIRILFNPKSLSECSPWAPRRCLPQFCNSDPFWLRRRRGAWPEEKYHQLEDKKYKRKIHNKPAGVELADDCWAGLHRRGLSSLEPVFSLELVLRGVKIYWESNVINYSITTLWRREECTLAYHKIYVIERNKITNKCN